MHVFVYLGEHKCVHVHLCMYFVHIDLYVHLYVYICVHLCI